MIFFFILIKFIYSPSKARKHVFKWLEPLIGGSRGTCSGWYFPPAVSEEYQGSSYIIPRFSVLFFFFPEGPFIRTFCASEFSHCKILSDVLCFRSARAKGMSLVFLKNCADDSESLVV